MSAAKKATPKGKKKGRVDVDRTRESLERLGLEQTGERLGELLSDAVKADVPAHRFLDRLLDRCHVLKIKGRSYRLRDLERLVQEGDAPHSEPGRLITHSRSRVVRVRVP